MQGRGRRVTSEDQSPSQGRPRRPREGWGVVGVKSMHQVYEESAESSLKMF